MAEAAPIRRPATYADLEAAPPGLVAEILDGELVTHPRPLPRHAIAQGALGAELGEPFQKGRGGPGGWIFMPEPELHVGEHVVVPDLAGWRRERMPYLPIEVGITIVPEWICEVISPSTASYDRTVKFRIYLEAGVKHLWYVDPAYKTLEVFKRETERWTLLATFADKDEVRVEPFETIAFPLSNLWPLEPPPEAPKT